MKIKGFMYQSREFIEKKSTNALKQYLVEFLKANSFIRCKALKNRKVFLNKLPDAITKRQNASSRLRCFWVAMDILKKSNGVNHRVCDGKKEYEVWGFSAEGKKVYIHLREEVTKKDKRLFLISTYYQA